MSLSLLICYIGTNPLHQGAPTYNAHEHTKLHFNRGTDGMSSPPTQREEGDLTQRE